MSTNRITVTLGLVTICIACGQKQQMEKPTPVAVVSNDSSLSAPPRMTPTKPWLSREVQVFRAEDCPMPALTQVTIDSVDMKTPACELAKTSLSLEELCALAGKLPSFTVFEKSEIVLYTPWADKSSSATKSGLWKSKDAASMNHIGLHANGRMDYDLKGSSFYTLCVVRVPNKNGHFRVRFRYLAQA
jgi:hypothetical protein